MITYAASSDLEAGVTDPSNPQQSNSNCFNPQDDISPAQTEAPTGAIEVVKSPLRCCILLCFAGPSEVASATMVRCKRPPASLQARAWRAQLDPIPNKEQKTTEPRTKYGASLQQQGSGDVDAKSYESDGEIFDTLQRTAISKHGLWKAWVPLYGIVNVEEVTFKFEGLVDKNGRVPVKTTRLDIDQIRAKCSEERDEQHRIAGDLIDGRCIRDTGDSQCDGYENHSDGCRIGIEHWSQECARVQAETAEARLEKLDKLHQLTSSFLHPMNANGGDTLSGLAQDSCVYVLQPEKLVDICLPDDNNTITVFDDNSWEYNSSTVYRGLYVKFGWQRNKMREGFTICLSFAFAMVFVVWFCTFIIGGQTGNWQAAFGLGSLAIASVALLWGKLQY